MVGPAWQAPARGPVPLLCLGGDGVGAHRASPCWRGLHPAHRQHQRALVLQELGAGRCNPPGVVAGSIKLQILVYRIEKFLSKLCTVIFAQYLCGGVFFLLVVFFFFFFLLFHKILEQ